MSNIPSWLGIVPGAASPKQDDGIVPSVPGFALTPQPEATAASPAVTQPLVPLNPALGTPAVEDLELGASPAAVSTNPAVATGSSISADGFFVWAEKNRAKVDAMLASMT